MLVCKMVEMASWNGRLDLGCSWCRCGGKRDCEVHDSAWDGSGFGFLGRPTIKCKDQAKGTGLELGVCEGVAAGALGEPSSSIQTSTLDFFKSRPQGENFPWAETLSLRLVRQEADAAKARAAEARTTEAKAADANATDAKAAEARVATADESAVGAKAAEYCRRAEGCVGDCC